MLLYPAEVHRDLPDHEPFIDSLVERNLVVLGGELEPPASEATVAYVLSCSSELEASVLTASDPLVSTGCMRAEVVEWQLVGFNPDAVDPKLLLWPDDIAC